MKKYVIMFMIAMLSLIPSIAYGQTPPATASAVASAVPTMSKEDIEKIRQQLDQLSKAMDGSAGAPSVTPPSKTVGDVADKALGMFSGAIASLSSTMQKVAPEVWRIMIRQQYAKAISAIISPTFIIVIVILYSIIIRKIWVPVKNQPGSYNEDEHIWQVVLQSFLPLITGIIFGCIFAHNASDAIPLLLNPEYYAIKDLLKMILSPGSMN